MPENLLFFFPMKAVLKLNPSLLPPLVLRTGGNTLISKSYIELEKKKKENTSPTLYEWEF